MNNMLRLKIHPQRPMTCSDHHVPTDA
jgi:hypothetical protein